MSSGRAPVSQWRTPLLGLALLAIVAAVFGTLASALPVEAAATVSANRLYVPHGGTVNLTVVGEDDDDGAGFGDIHTSASDGDATVGDDTLALVSCTDDEGLHPCANADGDPHQVWIQAGAGAGQTGSWEGDLTLNIVLLANCPDAEETITVETRQPIGTITDSVEIVCLPVSISKTATGVAPEEGGPVEFTVTISNGDSDPITISSLTDDIFGDITQVQGDIEETDCATPQVIAGNSSYECTFTAFVEGEAPDFPSHINNLIATVENFGDIDDSHTIRFLDVTMTKTPDVASVPESDQEVTFTVFIENNENVAATISDYDDSVFGDLSVLLDSTCATGVLLESAGNAGDSYQCTFTVELGGVAGDTHVNVLDVLLTYDNQEILTLRAEATVDILDVLPDITVTKSADDTLVPASGQDVTYTVTVTNNTDESLFLMDLDDDQFGDLDNVGTCDADGQTILPGDTYECEFTEFISGAPGGSHTNVVTATALDDEQNEATDSDSETVEFEEIDESDDPFRPRPGTPGTPPYLGGGLFFGAPPQPYAAPLATPVAVQPITPPSTGDAGLAGSSTSAGIVVGLASLALLALVARRALRA